LHRNCLLKHIIGGKMEEWIEVAGWQGKRRNQLLDDRKETREYWELKGHAIDRTMWRTRFGRGCRSVVRQTTKWVSEQCTCFSTQH
jgi:hypothetical protein